MFKNYQLPIGFKTAWRNILNHKVFSTINILGLALGIACSLLIMLWVRDEKSVDGFHKNGAYLFQVYERSYFDGKTEAGYSTQGLLARELKKVIPDVQYACSMDYAAAPGTSSTFEAADKIIKMKGYFAGEDIFKMFTFPLLEGKANTAIAAAGNIAISRRMAEEFFGNAYNAINKTIRFENKEELKITAVFENVPSTSSLQFDFLRSWVDFVSQNAWVNNWGNTSPTTFVQLKENASAATTASKMKGFIYRYQPKDRSVRTELALQSYPEKYLHSNFKNGYIDGGRIEYVSLFTIVAIFILLIACINFMNLSTAQAAKRAKEIGLRKVVGARRFSLARQFIGEAMLITSFSMLLGLLLILLLLPAFNTLTGKQLHLPVGLPSFWMSLIGLLLVTGFVAGSYPALFLSSFKPVSILQGGVKFGGGNVFLRKSLVVLQFTLSVSFIAAMIVIYQQVNYIQTKDIGYQRDNLVYIPVEGDLIKNYEVFKSEAQRMPGVESITKMRNSPTVIEHHTSSIQWPGKDPNASVSFADAVVGYDFAKTMKLAMASGRDFSKEFGSDSTGYLINETAAARMGFQEPLGQTITWGNHDGRILGVVKDFHFNSMHQAIDPLIVRLDENWSWGTILVRTKAGNIQKTLTGLEQLCKQLNPKFPFTYQFSDKEFEKLYKSELVVSRLSDYFAFLAIFISSLGLFGLATFTAAQRNKEIGVRKVLGASVANVVALLYGSFIRPVFISIALSLPLVWYMMNKWLSGFEYRITMDWKIFLFAGLITVFIALITVSYQSIKAALGNPVKVLRMNG